MTNDKLLDLARKVKALAEKGIDGEKGAAANALARLMKKHGISIDDIEGEKKSRRLFAYKDKNEKELLLQVLGSVVLFDTYYSRLDRTKLVGLDMTDAEYIEAEYKWEIYRRLLREEYAIFYHAFVVQNHIFHPDRKKTDTSTLTPEERAKLRRVSAMSETIKRAQILKQLQEAQR